MPSKLSWIRPMDQEETSTVSWLRGLNFRTSGQTPLLLNGLCSHTSSHTPILASPSSFCPFPVLDIDPIHGHTYSAGAKGTKRTAAAASGGGEVAQDVAAAYQAFDWGELSGRDGGLEKLTIKDLKLYLQYNKLPVSGNKGEICARIRKHMESL